MSINVPINVRLNRGTAYSTDRRQTTWSLFDTALVALPGSLIYIPYPRLFTVANQPVSAWAVSTFVVNRLVPK